LGKVKPPETTERRKNVQNRTESTLTKKVREGARTLTGASQDYDPLIDLVGDARFVLIGEASHGTHDFYHERAQITERLIKEKGFTAVGRSGLA
jgi:erythromycin esterase-like protein